MAKYRIDDLARASGVTTRNIRGYQEHGLLPAPLKQGRIAIYTERHLACLRAITALLGRGFTLKHIATFLTHPRARVGEALGINEVLVASWSTQDPVEMTRAEVEETLGNVDDDILEKLLDAQILTRTDSGRLAAADPSIVDNLGRLVRRGMPLETLIDVHAQFTAKLGDAVHVLMQSAHDEFIRRRGSGWQPQTTDEIEWVTDLLTTMRQVATENSYAALDRALDDALAAQIQVHRAAVERRD